MRIPKFGWLPVKAILMLMAMPMLIGGCPGCGDDESDIYDPEQNASTIWLAADNGYPLGFTGDSYDFEVQVMGMDAPYTFEESESIPPPEWLSLSMNGPDHLKLTGTPDAAGGHTFWLYFTDTNGKGNGVMLTIIVMDSDEFWLTGDWEMTKTHVFVLGVLCDGEEDEPPSIETMLLTRSGSHVTISGFLGAGGNTISGEIYPSRDDQQWVAHIRLSGSYPEDGGTTTVVLMNLDMVDSNELVGAESWVWDIDDGSCNGLADVTMARIP